MDVLSELQMEEYEGNHIISVLSDMKMKQYTEIWRHFRSFRTPLNLYYSKFATTPSMLGEVFIFQLHYRDQRYFWGDSNLHSISQGSACRLYTKSECVFHEGKNSLSSFCSSYKTTVEYLANAMFILARVKTRTDIPGCLASFSWHLAGTLTFT